MYQLLDQRTEDELASGKYHDQRRASFGTRIAARVERPAAAAPAPRPRPPAPPPGAARQPWSRSQENLAFLYNGQGVCDLTRSRAGSG